MFDAANDFKCSVTNDLLSSDIIYDRPQFSGISRKCIHVKWVQYLGIRMVLEVWYIYFDIIFAEIFLHTVYCVICGKVGGGSTACCL